MSCFADLVSKIVFVFVFLNRGRQTVVWPIPFCLVAKLASGNRKPTSQNYISTSLWPVGYCDLHIGGGDCSMGIIFLYVKLT